MFLTMTGYGIVLPTLPFIADALNLSSVQMSSLIIIWAISQLITAPLWGRLTDKKGRKPVLLFGLFGFGIAFLILIFAQNYLQLLLARMIGAALSSGTFPAVIAMVSDQTEKKNRSQVIAKMGAVNGLGFLCGPAVGGLFSPFGVTVPFIVAASLAFFTLPFAYMFIKESNPSLEEDKESLANDKNEQSLWKSISMMAKKGYWNLYVITLGLSIAASSFFGLLGYYMIARFDASPVFVSMAFSVQAGMSVTVQFFLIKRVSEVWEEETITKIGLLIATIGYCLISFSPIIWLVIAGCIFTGFGQALVRPTITAMLSKRDQMGQGITMGLQHSIDSLGRIVGPFWGGWIFAFNVSGPFITSAFITALLLIISYSISNSQKTKLPKLNQKDTSV